MSSNWLWAPFISVPFFFKVFDSFDMIMFLFDHLDLLRSNRSLRTPNKHVLGSFSGHSDFPSRFPFLFCLILGTEKRLRSKIELDSWKEWIRNSALQMRNFCRNLLGEIESNSSRHDLHHFGKNWCVTETVAWRFQNADIKNKNY